jgi:aspartate/methionine/tyrosine aminotransferase
LPVPVPTDGAAYVYFDVSWTGLTSWHFCERVLDEVHVALMPGKDIGHCGADRYVRLSYAARAENLTESIRRLGTFMTYFRR